MSTLTRWLIAAAVVVAIGHFAAVESISAQQEAEDIASDVSQAKRQAIAERPRKSESIAGTLLAVAIALGLVLAVFAWATEEPVNPMPQAKKERWERAIEASFRSEKQK